MARQKRISSKTKASAKTGKGRIDAFRDEQISNAYITFSLRFLECRHSVFRFNAKEAQYYEKLIERLHELSNWKAQEFLSNRSAALRAHPIDFRDSRVKADTFGIPGWEECDELAYQFAVSRSLGRVHGFLIDTVFYVRWIDPDHRLYPMKNR